METARALTENLVSLLRREHGALAEFLVALADFDRRRLWVDLGHSSLWYFLHRELRLSKSGAQYRKVAAELIQEIPGVVEPLRRGELCLTSLIEVAKVVTIENWEMLLPRFYGLSRREAAEVAAALQPHPAPPIRTVVTPVRSAVTSRGDAPAHGLARVAPQPIDRAAEGARSRGAVATQRNATSEAPSLFVSSSEEPVPCLAVSSAPPVTGVASLLTSIVPAMQVMPATSTHQATLATAATPATATTRAARAAEPREFEVAPLTADQSRVHLTVSKGFLKKLTAATDAMSHAVPRATPAEILEAGLDLLLAKADKRKGLVQRPQKQPRPTKGDGIPAHVRREVWSRDGGKCQWKLASGGICGATRNLELDHIRPRSMGGASTADNLRVACKSHNDLAARLILGDDLMDRYSSGLRGGSNRPERLREARRSADGVRDQQPPTGLFDRIGPRRPAAPAAGPGAAAASRVCAGSPTA